MLWKLLASLAIALACLPAPAAFARDEEDEAGATAEDEGAREEEAKADEEGQGEEEESAYDRDGWYAGIGGAYAFAKFDEGDSGDSGDVNLRAGYHFLRFAALEVQLEYLPEFNGDLGKFAGVDTALWSAWLAAKGYPTAPWTGLIQPYVLGGIAWMWERQTGPAISGSNEDGAFAMRVGGGIDVYVTKNIVLTADSSWVVPTGNLEDLRHVTVGGAVQYRF